MNRLTLFMAGMMALFVSGCLNIDYVGRKLPADPAGEVIEFYSDGLVVPEGVYDAIGRGTLECDGSTPIGDIREAFIEKAREVGANAVEIVSFKRIPVGVLMENPEFVQPDNEVTSDFNTAVGGRQRYIDTFGNQVMSQNNDAIQYELIIVARFLADKVRFEEFSQEWDEAKRLRNEKLLEELTAKDAALRSSILDGEKDPEIEFPEQVPEKAQ